MSHDAISTARLSAAKHPLPTTIGVALFLLAALILATVIAGWLPLNSAWPGSSPAAPRPASNTAVRSAGWTWTPTYR